MNYLLPGLVFFPMLAALWMPLLGAKHSFWRDRLMQISSFVVFGLSLLLPRYSGIVSLPGVVGLGLNFSSESLQIVLTILATFVFFLSSLASPAYFKGHSHISRYAFFFLLTEGALLGVFLSADLFTTFIFFEMMSFTSWIWVAQNETEKSRKAAYTYLAIAVAGGMVLLFGLMLLQSNLNTLFFREILQARKQANPTTMWAAALCLLVGFGAKAGVFPLHIWLPKAHPEAPAPASALLSGILTKAGIFGIFLLALFLMPGNYGFALLLLGLGTITMLLGAILALLSDDLKRTLACSSLSQIGFIVVSISLLAANHDTPLAVGGALLHVVNHALTKAVLFIGAGSLYQVYHTNDLNRLRGAGRGSHLLMLCFLIGGLSLAGFPGLGGYISKTLIHEAIVENMHVWQAFYLRLVELLFLFSGGLTLAYMSKLFITIFMQKPAKNEQAPVHGAVGTGWATGLAISVPALALVLLGAFPNEGYQPILQYTSGFFNIHAHTVDWFSWINLKGALTSLLIGASIYILIVRGLLTSRDGHGTVRVIPPGIDLEKNFYLPTINALVFVGAFLSRILHEACEITINMLIFIGAFLSRLFHTASGGLVGPLETVFQNKNPHVVEGTDNHFALYSRSYVAPGRYGQTLAFELMLFGIGLIITLFYLLIVNHS